MWQGDWLKKELKAKGLSASRLAKELGVSRTAVSDWIKGSIPRGHHLVNISRVLNVSPESFFLKDSSDISMPVHRKRLAGRIKESDKNTSLELAGEYLNFFRNSRPPVLKFVTHISDKEEDQLALAKNMRELSGVDYSDPIDYQHVFKLYKELSIVAIFRDFPKSIKKAYAFHSNINNHRVVFINNDTHLNDLIFALLHEAIHTIIDPKDRVQTGFYEEIEEKFCDNVAGLIQFPPAYIDRIEKATKGLRKAQKVTTVKFFANEYSHATYGIAKIIKDTRPGVLDDISLNVFAGADSNIRKITPKIGDIIFESDSPKDYIDNLKALSPIFIMILKQQLENASLHKIGEWLGLESSSDARLAIDELRR